MLCPRLPADTAITASMKLQISAIHRSCDPLPAAGALHRRGLAAPPGGGAPSAPADTPVKFRPGTRRPGGRALFVFHIRGIHRRSSKDGDSEMPRDSAPPHREDRSPLGECAPRVDRGRDGGLAEGRGAVGESHRTDKRGGRHRPRPVRRTERGWMSARRWRRMGATSRTRPPRSP